MGDYRFYAVFTVTKQALGTSDSILLHNSAMLLYSNPHSGNTIRELAGA
jgi:hypothetical protein